MSYYSTNPHYNPVDTREDDARLERAEREAGSWFDYASKPQAARYREQIEVISAYKDSPRWLRMRDAIKAEFAATTKEAAALCDETVQHYLAHGEVLEELADRWEALAAKTNAKAEAEKAVGDKIITTNVYPPIPVRDFDWCATRSNDEPNDNGSMLAGYGRTEAEAIAGLVLQAAE